MKENSHNQPMGGDQRFFDAEMPALLIVEREPLISRYIKSIVAQMEIFRVFEVKNCSEAAQILEQETPMVLMVDIGLYPEEASDLIDKARSSQAHLPFVIALSAASSDGSNFGDSFGADYYLDKNFSRNELTGVLNNIKRQSDYIQRIAEKELHYRTIFDFSEEPLMLINSTTYSVIDINHAALHLLGFSQGVDQPELCSNIISSQNLFQRIIRNKITYASGIKIRKLNQRDFMATASFVYFDHQEMVLMSIKDNTESMRSQDETQAINRLMSQGGFNTKEVISYLRGEKNERRRISRELHDHVGQMLVSIKMGIENARSVARDSSVEALLENIRNNITSTIAALRATTTDISNDTIPETNLADAIIELTKKMQLKSYFVVNIEIEPMDLQLNGFMQSNIYRIAEESLTNIVKHSNGGHVFVRLQVEAKELVLSIERRGEDSGSQVKKGGMGIQIMQQRAAMIGGSLEIEGVAGKQFTVKLKVPL